MEVRVEGWNTIIDEVNKVVSIGIYDSLRGIEVQMRALLPEIFYKLLAAQMKTDPMYGPHEDNVRKEFILNITRGGNIKYGNYIAVTLQTNPVERRGTLVDIGSFWLLGRGPRRKMNKKVEGPILNSDYPMFLTDPSHGTQEPRLEIALKCLEEAMYSVIALLEFES